MKYTYTLLLTAASSFLCGALISSVYFSQNDTAVFTEVRKKDPGYDFIYPLLDSNTNILLPKSTQKNHTEIRDLIENQKNTDLITDVSVYYRDLRNGPSFTIHGNTTYTPASLLKVPTLISYLALAQTNTTLLDEQLIYKEEINAPPFFRENASDFIRSGNTYSVEELLRNMIIYSDNYATILLQKNIPSRQDVVYDDFNLPLPPLINVYNPFLTVTQFAAFFRILFNGTYLTHEFSNFALQLLSQTTYANGIRAGVPNDIVVASKYGVYESEDYIELHECGIVYATNRPYILCIMTRGTSAPAQEIIVQKISDLVYSHTQLRL